MKILGKALLRDYSGIVCGKGLVVDCTEEEFKETGNKYIRDKNNLFQKKYFSLFFHNEQHMYGYNPSYANEIGKKLGFKYSRHIQDSDIYVIKFMPIAQFSKIKIM